MEVETTGNRISFMECVLFTEHAIVTDEGQQEFRYCLLSEDLMMHLGRQAYMDKGQES